MILIYIKVRSGYGEPSVVAIDQNTNKILAVGSEAKRMLGRTPGNVVAVRPLQSGVIANYTMTEAMIRHFLKKFCPASISFYAIE